MSVARGADEDVGGGVGASTHLKNLHERSGPRLHDQNSRPLCGESAFATTRFTDDWPHLHTGAADTSMKHRMKINKYFLFIF